MLISSNSNSNRYKDIGIQSVAYGSCLSPLLSGKYQISLSLPLAAKSLTLHSRSVWLLSGKTQIIHIRHLGLRNRFLQMYTYMSWTAGSRPHKSQNLFFFRTNILQKSLKINLDIQFFFLSKLKEFNHELKLFKTYHSSYGLYRYAGTTHMRITIAPTCTKIKNNVATLARHI